MSHPSGSADPNEPVAPPVKGPAVPDRGPVDALAQDLAALRSYAAHYLAARIDGLRARLRRAAAWTVLILAAAVAGLTVLVTSVVLLLEGVADGLAVALGRPWAGKLATGAGLLVFIALSAGLGLRWWLNSSLKKTRAEYERRRSQQRRAFGQDAAQRAADRPDAR